MDSDLMCDYSNLCKGEKPGNKGIGIMVNNGIMVSYKSLRRQRMGKICNFLKFPNIFY